MRISRAFIAAVKLSDMRSYQIAHKAGVCPSTLSRLLNGIDEARPGDERITRIAKVVGLRAKECFEEDEEIFHEGDVGSEQRTQG